MSHFQFPNDNKVPTGSYTFLIKNENYYTIHNYANSFYVDISLGSVHDSIVNKMTLQELRSYTEVLKIDPAHHPNIIGRKGATINKIRDDFDVRIQLPEKDHAHSDEITVIGYEHQVHLAKEAILKIVQTLVSNLIISDLCIFPEV